jgi:hypothetical protein
MLRKSFAGTFPLILSISFNPCPILIFSFYYLVSMKTKYHTGMIKLFVFLAAGFLLSACTPSGKKLNEKESSHVVLFEDHFNYESQGAFVENVIHLPPPQGLGYDWKVLEGGFIPSKWIHSDELQPDDPKKGFWVIPADSGYLAQGGRSHNSVLFAGIPVPADTEEYTITFRQMRGDNDPIMFVLGAPEPVFNSGYEIGYMIQVPGTDSTTNNAFIIGALGEMVVEEAAFAHTWAEHQIDVQGQQVKWTCNNKLMAEGTIEGLKPGYFGIRHRYERNTYYDDVKITLLK